MISLLLSVSETRGKYRPVKQKLKIVDWAYPTACNVTATVNCLRFGWHCVLYKIYLLTYTLLIEGKCTCDC